MYADMMARHGITPLDITEIEFDTEWDEDGQSSKVTQMRWGDPYRDYVEISDDMLMRDNMVPIFIMAVEKFKLKFICYDGRTYLFKRGVANGV